MFTPRLQRGHVRWTVRYCVSGSRVKERRVEGGARNRERGKTAPSFNGFRELLRRVALAELRRIELRIVLRRPSVAVHLALRLRGEVHLLRRCAGEPLRLQRR